MLIIRSLREQVNDCICEIMTEFLPEFAHDRITEFCLRLLHDCDRRRPPAEVFRDLKEEWTKLKRPTGYESTYHRKVTYDDPPPMQHRIEITLSRRVPGTISFMNIQSFESAPISDLKALDVFGVLIDRLRGEAE
jgi:hypothetical protein